MIDTSAKLNDGKTIQKLWEENNRQLPMWVESILPEASRVKVLSRTSKAVWIGEKESGDIWSCEIDAAMWKHYSRPVTKIYELRQHFQGDSLENLKHTGFVSFNEIK